MFESLLYLFSINLILQNEQPTPIYIQNERKQSNEVLQKERVLSAEVRKPELQGSKYLGIASFYSRAGCVGCSGNFTMANGQPLDDNRLTVAFMRATLGTMVKITNVKTGQSVTAEVTDRGGFEEIGRIIDLSVATKEAIGCSSLCEVEVEL